MSVMEKILMFLCGSFAVLSIVCVVICLVFAFSGDLDTAIKWAIGIMVFVTLGWITIGIAKLKGYF